MTERDFAKEKFKELDPREQRNLIKLKEKLKSSEISPQVVGQILPEAIIIGEDDHHNISKSMIDITERAIDYSVSKDPDILSSYLFPIIGAAIRKAVKNAMEELMMNLNAGLEKTFSWKRLAWRFESIKTGIPFIEIVLRNTLQYRVEHVFLIHSKTGLLLHSISNKETLTADKDIVASMLTVVQDYIRDSLSLNKEENVNSISTGEYTILIEAGPRAIISLVVRGTPDTIVRDKMAEAIENIHLRLSGALSTFSGNTELFEKEEALLRPCLISREKGDKKKKPVYAIIALMIIGALITAITVFSFSASLNSRIFLEALNNEKGILIASHYRRGGKTEVRLLRDARARKIDEIAAGYSIDIEKFIFAEEEFISPLFGPAYVSADRAIPDELLALARRLKGYILFFEQDSGELRIGQEETVREAGTLITEIIDKAKESGFKVNVELTGHTAGNIQDPDSLRISRERAEKAMKLFEDLNAPLAQYVTPRGVGISEPVAQDEATDEERILNRSVTFKAVFE